AILFSYVWSSPDGVVWTRQYSSSRTNALDVHTVINSVVYGNGRAVIVGTGGVIAQSDLLIGRPKFTLASHSGDEIHAIVEVEPGANLQIETSKNSRDWEPLNRQLVPAVWPFTWEAGCLHGAI